MSRCNYCRDKGVVRIEYTGYQGGYDLASCACEQGKWWKRKGQLRAQAAQMDPKPERIGRLEEFIDVGK